MLFPKGHVVQRSPGSAGEISRERVAEFLLRFALRAHDIKHGRLARAWVVDVRPDGSAEVRHATSADLPTGEQVDEPEE